MSRQRERLKWVMRRRREDDSRKRTTIPRKIRQKVTNLLRRLTIFVTRTYMKRYSRKPLPVLATTRSILIIPHDPIGDLLLTEPVWRKLKKENPALRIGLAISSRNKSLAAILPGIDERYNFYGGSLRERFSEIRRAWHDRYDVVLVPAGFYKPARFAFISRFVAGASGFTATMHQSRPKRYADFYSYCTERAWEPYPQAMVEQYEALVEAVFGVQFDDVERSPRLLLPQQIRELGIEIVDRVRKETGCSRVILVHLEAKVEPREWGIANIERLVEDMPDTAFLLSASPHYWDRYPVPNSMPDRVRVAQTASILDAAALVAAADLLISPDTSMVHFAAALERPIVAFYPYPDEWHPYRAKSVVLYPALHEPISTIAVADVRNAITTLLGD